MSQSFLAYEKIRSHQTYHSFLFNEQKGQEERKKEKLIFLKSQISQMVADLTISKHIFSETTKKAEIDSFFKINGGCL